MSYLAGLILAIGFWGTLWLIDWLHEPDTRAEDLAQEEFEEQWKFEELYKTELEEEYKNEL